MRYTHRNQQRIDEGLGSLLGKFFTKIFGRTAAKTGGKVATKGIGSKIGKMALGKGAVATGLGVAGGYGIDKFTNNEKQFDSRDVIAKLTSDIQAFGQAVDYNTDLSAEGRTKVKEYMKDIEEMLTQDLERREKYITRNNTNQGYDNINPNPSNNWFDYGYTNTYRDNMYAPGHRR